LCHWLLLLAASRNVVDSHWLVVGSHWLVSLAASRTVVSLAAVTGYKPNSRTLYTTLSSVMKLRFQAADR
jgi:hypothetical protein